MPFVKKDYHLVSIKTKCLSLLVCQGFIISIVPIVPIDLDSNKELNILSKGPELSLLCLDCAINDDVEAEEHRLYTRYSLY